MRRSHAAAAAPPSFLLVEAVWSKNSFKNSDEIPLRIMTKFLKNSNGIVGLEFFWSSSVYSSDKISTGEKLTNTKLILLHFIYLFNFSGRDFLTGTDGIGLEFRSQKQPASPIE